MQKKIHLLLTIVFCFLGWNTVTVHACPKYVGESKKFGSVQLYFDDTSSAEYQQMRYKLDSFYKLQAARGFNGSVLIGYQGHIIYERYFGFADKNRNIKLTKDAPVQLASTSKTFTATAVMYLHQHKYLNIDHTVQTYLPSFPYPQITVKMLLNHRSGLPDYLKWWGRYKNTVTPAYNDELLAMFAKYKPALDFPSNTRFKYSNSNYAILARLIEEVTEMKYKDFMKQYFFEPIGMKNTFVYDPADGFPVNTTKSYHPNWLEYPIVFSDGIYGDKGIYSTVRDMYRWDQSFYDNEFLDSNTTEYAYGPCSFETGGVKNYGLGWRMYCYPDGDKVVFHNGWWHGNNTVFLRFIKDNFTIIVLGNKYNKGIYQHGPAIYKILSNSSAASAEFEDEGAE